MSIEMQKTNNTGNKTRVRDATEAELLDLITYVNMHFMGSDREGGKDIVESAYIVVIEDYMPDCPGEFGNIMVVIWSGGIEFHECYKWNKEGKLYRIVSCDEEWAAQLGEAKEIYP